jgi:hypothetical protein
VGLLYHRPRILDEAAAEEHQRQRHQHRTLVDGIEHPLEIAADAVFRLDQHDLRAIPPEAAEHVDIGGKFQRRHHDLPPRSVVAEAGADDALRHAGVLVHRDGTRRRADHGREQIADGASHLPPAL